MGLKFNSAKAIEKLNEIAITKVNALADKFKEDVLNEWKWESSEAKSKRQIIITNIDDITGQIIRQIESNAWVIADTYGTGSLMLKDNPALAAYKANRGTSEGQYNPNRPDEVIRGRPKGTYVDFFGRTRKTSGKLKGFNLEGRKFGKGNYEFRAVKPSKALINAMYWYRQQRLFRSIDELYAELIDYLPECFEMTMEV